MKRLTNIILLFLLLSTVAGCATVPESARDNRDPWEPYNRSVFKFNDALDKSLITPVTRGYQKVTPDFVETGVSNFFSNLGDVGNSINNLLQGKPRDAASDLLRVAINTTVGIGGLFDVASRTGLEKHNEDFGQTLGVWGVGSGPYFMLPFLGPSTLRDTSGRVVDWYADPVTYLSDEELRIALTAMELLDLRSQTLKTQDILSTDFYDPYAVIRDAYLKRREILLTDGAVSKETASEEDELLKELESFE